VQAYSDVLDLVVNIENNENVLPIDDVEINFSQPVFARDYENKIDIFPRIDFDIQWKNYNRTLIISPKDAWEIETNYRINMPEGHSWFYTKNFSQNLSLSTIEYPVVSNVVPAMGSENVLLDIEDPIIIDFKKPVDNFWIKFNFDPSLEVSYEINAEKNQFKIIPKANIQAGVRYNMSVMAKYKQASDDTYKEIFTSNFKTLALAPENWENDLVLRVAQAKRFTSAQIKEGKYIDINLASQIMTIFEDGRALDAFVVSSGKRGMDTPKGTFKIENKAARPWSAAYGLYMPNWMAIVPSGKFGIHELPEWPSGYKEGESHLGTPVSHGCVRLGVGAAKQVFDWAELGMPVVIH